MVVSNALAYTWTVENNTNTPINAQIVAMLPLVGRERQRFSAILPAGKKAEINTGTKCLVQAEVFFGNNQLSKTWTPALGYECPGRTITVTGDDPRLSKISVGS